MIILGVDPGTVRIGYGIVEQRGGRLSYVQSGLLKAPERLSENERLPLIESSFVKLLAAARPHRLGIERLFFAKNQKTALSVAQARGVLINAAVKQGISIFERTPLEVKIAVTSNGRASKEAVAFMVRRLLALPATYRPVDDVTDALAVAIAVANASLWRS